MNQPKKRLRQKQLSQEAIKLLRDPNFLFRLSEQIEALGIVGERRNRLIIFLAALTARFEAPVSVLVKGPSSSGKSNLVRTVLRLLPTERVIERASLSPKAPVHGPEQLRGKVLYVAEQKGTRDAQLLLRLLQSEGDITHEYTTVAGRARSTEVVRRKGRPAVITTTTEDRVFEDDETRFLSLWVDRSASQTRAILRAQVGTPAPRDTHAIEVYRRATRILLEHKVSCEVPAWFRTVAEFVPADVRSRRDWPRCMELCKAIAVSRIYSSRRERKSKIKVELSDYAIAYRLLNRVFSRSASKVHTSTNDLVEAVTKTYRKTGNSVSTGEIRRRLGWERSTTYKHARLAVKLGYLKYDSVIRQNNERRLIPRSTQRGDFLPSPQLLLKRHKELTQAKYTDPINGKPRLIERKGKK